MRRKGGGQRAKENFGGGEQGRLRYRTNPLHPIGPLAQDETVNASTSIHGSDGELTIIVGPHFLSPVLVGRGSFGAPNPTVQDLFFFPSRSKRCPAHSICEDC